MRLSVNPVAALGAVLGWVKFYWFGHRGCQALPRLERGRVLLTWPDDTPCLNDMILPVINELGPGQCNVIGGSPAVRRPVSSKTGFCTKYQICKVDFLEKVQPSLILTDSEHNHPWACLILAARKLETPTMQMMHGVIYGAYDYQPLLSDVAL